MDDLDCGGAPSEVDGDRFAFGNRTLALLNWLTSPLN